MKLFATSLLVAARAQDLADLIDFDELGLDLAAFGFDVDDLNLSPVGALDDALATEDSGRYFAASPAATSAPITSAPAASVSGGCYKCDEMTMINCAIAGVFETCDEGEQSSCFVEVRETHQGLTQLCTGCKNTQACNDLRANNFQGTWANHQCRSHYVLQRKGARGGNQQSVCRQCFQPCASPTAVNCFNGHSLDFDTPSQNAVTALGFTGNKVISFNFNAMVNDVVFQAATSGANHPLHYFTGANSVGIGIPTNALLPLGSDTDKIEDYADNKAWNLYFATSDDGALGTGKVHPESSMLTNTLNTAQKAPRRMVYWSIIGADSSWWKSDLEGIQEAAKSAVGSGQSGATAIIV